MVSSSGDPSAFDPNQRGGVLPLVEVAVEAGKYEVTSFYNGRHLGVQRSRSHAGGDGGLEHGSLVEKQEEGVVADCAPSLFACTGTTEALQ